MLRPRSIPAAVLVSVSLLCAAQVHAQTFTSAGFVRGDSDCDGRVRITDAISLLDGLFRKAPLCCQGAGDVNADQRLDVTDVIHLLNFISAGTAAPVAPFPECGSEPSPLACEEPSCDAPPPLTRFLLYRRFYRADSAVLIVGRSPGISSRSRAAMLEELTQTVTDLDGIPLELIFTRGEEQRIETFDTAGKSPDETIQFLTEELSTTGSGDRLVAQFETAFQRVAELPGNRPLVMYVGDGWDGSWRASRSGRVPVEDDVRADMAALPIKVTEANTAGVTVHTIGTSVYTPCQTRILSDIAHGSEGGTFRGLGFVTGQGDVSTD